MKPGKKPPLGERKLKTSPAPGAKALGPRLFIRTPDLYRQIMRLEPPVVIAWTVSGCY